VPPFLKGDNMLNTAIVSESVVVGSNSVEALAAITSSSNRHFVSIVNDTSLGEVYLGVGVPAELGKGILLTSKGSSFVLETTSSIVNSAINAIGTTDAMRLAVLAW